MDNNNLFDNNRQSNSFLPLAERLRPTTLEDFVGQKHILGRGKPLYTLIKKGLISSVIFWGPPGVGKTTLARLIAQYTKSAFIEFSAVTSGVQDVRRVIKEAEERLKLYNKKTILFIDEIHRFNKAQQDAFLPSVEKGIITLIGATTENPSFEVNAPLISRSQVFVFYNLEKKDLLLVSSRALHYYKYIKFDDDALQHLIKSSGGDARTLLNSIEVAAKLSKHITLKIAEGAAQKKAIYYDKKGDWHYDTISAFIKSMRGNSPDGALYWLARMIKAGEDPVFIARRMIIFASEDIGNAQPTALVLATNCLQAVHMVGMPEAGIILAHCATYLAKAKKSRASYNGLMMALKDIDEKDMEPVPLQLRNATTSLMASLGYGKDYEWSDDSDYQKTIDFLPAKLRKRKYYNEENQ